MKKNSISEENYLKAIYHIQENHDRVLTNMLAEKLNTKAASITDMLKKLKAKNLVDYEKYQGVKLTAEGKNVALMIIRKHRLWEFFLVEKLNFGWEEVHDVAEELEHITSVELINRLEKYLDFPKKDPHGDPIPDRHGKILVDHTLLNLTELPVNTPAKVNSVKSQSATLLELLKHNHIELGTIVEVKKRFEYDESLQIKIKSYPAFTISSQLAHSIIVKPVNV